MTGKKKSAKLGKNPIASGSVFIGLMQARGVEASLRWRGVHLALPLNLTALFAVVLRLLLQPERTEMGMLALACFIIAGLDFEWYSVLRRAGKLFEFWNQKLKKLEQLNGIDGGLDVFARNEYETVSRPFNRVQRRLERIAVVMIYAWLVAGIVLSTRAIWSI